MIKDVVNAFNTFVNLQVVETPSGYMPLQGYAHHDGLRAMKTSTIRN